MGIGDTIKGLFKKADTGAGGPPPVEPAQQTTEGATDSPDAEVKPPTETTAEVKPLAGEPTNEPAAEINPPAQASPESVGTTSADQQEASPTPNVEGAQAPPDTPEG